MDEHPSEKAPPLSEPMTARFEIEDLDSATRQKEIMDAVAALPGVSGSQIAKGALHVTYDPLATSEKKIEEAVRGRGSTVTKVETETEIPHPQVKSGVQ